MFRAVARASTRFIGFFERYREFMNKICFALGLFGFTNK